MEVPALPIADLVALMEDSPATAELEAQVLAPEVPRTGGVSRRYCRLLYHLVATTKPERILEVGFANGISAAFLASALRATRPEAADAHVVLDPYQTEQWKGAGRELVRRLGLDGVVRVVEEPSYRAIPKLEEAGERFDLAFVDGNHCLDYVLTDVLLADRVLNVGGLIVLDDAPDFGVALAIPYLDQHRTNLRRVRFDGAMAHWLRERWLGRRRLSVYQKVGEDERGADAV